MHFIWRAAKHLCGVELIGKEVQPWIQGLCALCTIRTIPLQNNLFILSQFHRRCGVHLPQWWPQQACSCSAHQPRQSMAFSLSYSYYFIINAIYNNYIYRSCIATGLLSMYTTLFLHRCAGGMMQSNGLVE